MRRLPDALSSSRFLLAPIVGWALLAHRPAPALAALALACLTDLLDGVLARRLGTASPRGAALDVSADVAVVMAAYVPLAALGALPAWLPLALAAMFVRFLLVLRSGRPAYDPVGKHFGTVLYGGAIALVALPDTAVAWALSATVVILACGSLAGKAVLERLASGAANRGSPRARA